MYMVYIIERSDKTHFSITKNCISRPENKQNDLLNVIFILIWRECTFYGFDILMVLRNKIFWQYIYSYTVYISKQVIVPLLDVIQNIHCTQLRETNDEFRVHFRSFDILW